MAVGVGVGAEPAIAGPHTFFLHVLGGEGDRGAIIGPATHHVVLRAVTVALAVLPLVDAGADAFHVAAGDDVDHAGHGIGTVDGRCAVLQDLHAFDGGRGQGGDVLVAGGADAHALAVDQHQGALRAQPAHVHEAAASGLAGCQRAGAAECRAAHRGQVLQDVGDGVEALALDVGAADGQHRLRGFQVDLSDARTGDLDAVQRGRGGGILGQCGQGGGGAGRGQRTADRPTQRGGARRHAVSLSMCGNGHPKRGPVRPPRPASRRHPTNAQGSNSVKAESDHTPHQECRISRYLRTFNTLRALRRRKTCPERTPSSLASAAQSSSLATKKTTAPKGRGRGVAAARWIRSAAGTSCRRSGRCRSHRSTRTPSSAWCTSPGRTSRTRCWRRPTRWHPTAGCSGTARRGR